jgi:5'-phosphate synthase pdxT subunit
MTVERNAYGRQIDSRIAEIETDAGRTEAVFIRAPIIRRVGENARVLARYGGDPVLVEQGQHLVATFHPELSRDGSIHRWFLGKVKEANSLNLKDKCPDEPGHGGREGPRHPKLAT